VVETPVPELQTSAPEPLPETSTPQSAFFDNQVQPPDLPAPASNNSVSWTASEFIAHDKSPSWYVLLFGGAIILAGVTWLITKDIVAVGVIVLAVGVLAAYSSRKPRELQYTFDGSGITIGEKHYPYTLFRSFAVIEDGAFSSIELIPLKRFSPPLSIYYDPADEDTIARALTPHVPFHARKEDPIDQFMRRIRF
jgi:hypothetical protein